MTISKEQLLAYLETGSKEYEVFDNLLLKNDDDVLPILWSGLMAYYKCQLEKNKTLAVGETIQSVTAPSAQQQGDGKGGFFMVKQIVVRVKSPISEQVLPFLA
ncbi:MULTISPECIES: hypothetical protein [unclassified Microcoleus]|uniref:hypothetical protein n=1 Tax=unclassified Microcoleus TaxID=2642155 RepID=UPI002FD3631A